ncbi:MAG: hypothetical protein Q8P31_00340 [Bacillota bacterium]|nr:hypothetical protein [Bacillota bacterium]
MSIISSYSTKIRVAPRAARGVGSRTDPTWQMLHEAVVSVAAQLRGEVRAEISDYNGTTKTCDFAIVTPEFPRGVGITVSPSGEVRFMYDAYGGYKRHAQRICDLVTQSYTTVAVARALRAMAYEVDIEEHGQGSERRVMVRAVQ